MDSSGNGCAATAAAAYDEAAAAAAGVYVVTDLTLVGSSVRPSDEFKGHLVAM